MVDGRGRAVNALRRQSPEQAYRLHVSATERGHDIPFHCVFEPLRRLRRSMSFEINQGFLDWMWT